MVGLAVVGLAVVGLALVGVAVVGLALVDADVANFVAAMVFLPRAQPARLAAAIDPAGSSLGP